MRMCSLTIVRYPAWAVPFAIFSMALFRLPLWLNRRISFWKLMGCGRNGTFDIRPDWRQWALMAVHREPVDAGQWTEGFYGKFIPGFWRFFRAEIYSILLTPIEGHGTWDGGDPFGSLAARAEYEGPVAVLTRATIRLSKLGFFWKHVAPVASQMASAKGFITSVGIGEVPWVKQATFSVWASKEDMKQFAYGMKEHQEVIRLTRKQQWYSEDMFVRFRVAGTSGTLRGTDPIRGKLYL